MSKIDRILVWLVIAMLVVNTYSNFKRIWSNEHYTIELRQQVSLSSENSAKYETLIREYQQVGQKMDRLLQQFEEDDARHVE